MTMLTCCVAVLTKGWSPKINVPREITSTVFWGAEAKINVLTGHFSTFV